jgi:hypothetical protein
MKRFLIFYIFFSILLLVFLYFFTLIQETNNRSVDLYYELASEALQSDAIDPFMKYQSIAYQIIDTKEDTSYDIHVVHVLASIDEQYVNQFSVFVFPNKPINHATELEDSFDQTGIKLTNTLDREVIYQTSDDPEYDGYAVSYGIAIIGFYFYAIPLDESMDLTVELYDYQGQIIYQEDLSHIAKTSTEIQEIREAQSLLDTGFIPGYDEAEIEALLNLEATLRPTMMRNVTIFLVLDIAVGAFLYSLLKSRHQKERDE